MSLCIWCKNTVTENTLEHIIPEALGCPECFILNNGEICNPCNNRFGHIDHALISAFDFQALLAGVSRKNGKKAVISNKGNFYAQQTDDGPIIHVNMNKKSVSINNKVNLGGYGKSKRNVKGSFEINGDSWGGELKFEFGDDPKLVRALYKIGLEALVYFFGAETALNEEYDTIRKFVLTGKGDLKAILTFSNDKKYRNEVYNPYEKEGVGYGICIRIANILFHIDLTKKQKLLPVLEKELIKQHGSNGWTILPVKV